MQQRRRIEELQSTRHRQLQKPQDAWEWMATALVVAVADRDAQGIFARGIVRAVVANWAEV